MENLPQLRQRMSAVTDNYLDVQQDILETFIDRGQLRSLAEPTITSTGKRIPGLKLDHPRQLALMHALVRFANIAAGNTFTTAEIQPRVVEALGCPGQRYTLASLRYDLSKLRPKVSSPNFPTLAAIAFSRTAIPFAWSSSSSSNASMRRLRQAFSVHSRPMPDLNTKDDLSSIASTRMSSMDLTTC